MLARTMPGVTTKIWCCERLAGSAGSVSELSFSGAKMPIQESHERICRYWNIAVNKSGVQDKPQDSQRQDQSPVPFKEYAQGDRRTESPDNRQRNVDCNMPVGWRRCCDICLHSYFTERPPSATRVSALAARPCWAYFYSSFLGDPIHSNSTPGLCSAPSRRRKRKSTENIARGESGVLAS